MLVLLRCLQRGRAYDQIRNTIAHTNANVKICATHAGITVGEDGATHQMLEDISMMRTLPNMMVMSPSDDVQTKWAIKEIANVNGPVYVRLSRLATPVIYDEGFVKENNIKFEIGKAIQIGDGTDASIIATGVTVSEALKAQEVLKEKKHKCKSNRCSYYKTIRQRNDNKVCKRDEKNNYNRRP